MYFSKLDALVHYICARCENPSKLGATKLNKVLWYSDVLAFGQEGESISGTTYIKRQFGPVPRDILAARSRLVRDGAIVERKATFFGFPQDQFIALTPADPSIFSASQISLVDSVFEHVCHEHTASSISLLSHDAVWIAARIGEEIPLTAAAFGWNIGEIDEDDLAWANKEIERIESGPDRP